MPTATTVAQIDSSRAFLVSTPIANGMAFSETERPLIENSEGGRWKLEVRWLGHSPGHVADQWAADFSLRSGSRLQLYLGVRTSLDTVTNNERTPPELLAV